MKTAARTLHALGLALALGALFACNAGSKADAAAKTVEAPSAEPTPEPVAEDGESGAAMRDKGLSALRAQEFLGASVFFGQACDKGDLSACNELAKLLDEGRGITADPDRARDLWKQACAGGMQQACDQLGH